MENNGTCLWMLPEGCIAEILALTSPPDVCRLSTVSTCVKSAAEYDSVWEKFMPSDVHSIIARSLTPIPDFPLYKHLYVYLSHHPIFIDGGRKSFSLDKWTGKKCYFLGARDLDIAHRENPQIWKWTSLPESRFPEVAVLKYVEWLEIWGTIKAGILSPRTSYKAYFVYKFKDEYAFGFDYIASEVSVEISDVESKNQFAFLHPDGERKQDDDWNPYARRSYTSSSDEEIEGSEHYNRQDDPNILHPDGEQKQDDNWNPYVGPYTQPSDIEIEGFERYNWQDDPSILQADKQLAKVGDDGRFEVELGEFFCDNEDDCIGMSMKEVKGRFDYGPTEVSSEISGVESENRFAYLHPDGEQEQDDNSDPYDDIYTLPSDAEIDFGRYNWLDDPSYMQADKQLPKRRDDGWFEVELGEFFSENEDDCIKMRMKEVKGGIAKRGLIVEGIEIRPRMG